jgi:two-component system, cell cycle sensor histidine kinase and response regulator CckA
MRRCDMGQIESDLFQPRSFPAFSITRTVRLRETPINNLIRRTERVLPQYLNGNIATQIHLTDRDLRVMVDVGQMEEALANLIESSRDAMPEGGRLTISTGEGCFNGLHSRYGRCGFLSLSDTGPSRSFFPSRDNSEEALRLRLACHIIDLHNGYTRIEGLNGFGTTVYVYLPLVKSPMEQVATIPLGSAPMLMANDRFH